MRLAALTVCIATPALAQPKAPPLGSCTAELDARKVSYKRTARPGIETAVEITGPLGGVSYEGGPLVMDCSLAVSLDEAGRYLRGLGLHKATFSGAYSRRNVRDTNIPSKHSYGLAIDVHMFDALRIDRDFEMGLGDDVDCVGRPTSDGAATLKILQCQLVRSGLFHLVLTPDYDGDHRDHFHLEVSPWDARTALRSPAPAIH
jgi:hypothetical protein